jgi:hypothetical protein
MSNAVPIKAIEIMKWKGQINALTDTFKIILMQSGFVFNPVTHLSYADVSASELPTANGYTAGGITLTGVALAYDATDDRVELSHANATFTASGGSLVASGAIIFDDTTDTGASDDYSDVIVSYKDAGGDITAVDGTPIVITNILETSEDTSAS